MNYHWSECKLFSSWCELPLVRKHFLSVRVKYHWWKWIIIGQNVCFFQLDWIIIGQSELSSVRINIGQKACFCQLEWIIIGQSELSLVRCKFFLGGVNYHRSECMFLSVRVNYHRSKWIIISHECKLFSRGVNYHWSESMFLWELEWIIIMYVFFN